MRFIFLASMVLYLLTVSGCQPAPDCQDPLGCARFDQNQPVKIGIVTPRTDSRACPTAAEASAAIQIVLADQEISGRMISIIEEDSLNDPIIAQQRLNDLAEDPATVGLFYLDCGQDAGKVAQTAVNAGIPGFVNQLPADIEGLYPILPPTRVKADHLLRLLETSVDGALLVAVDPLDGPEELSHQICDRWRKTNKPCSVETYSEDLFAPAERAETLLVLSSRADSLAGADESLTAFSDVYWFDPSFSQPPDRLFRPEITPQPDSTPRFQTTWFAVQAAGMLLESLRSISFEKHGRLYMPRQALLAELNRKVFADCQADESACLASFDYTLYPFRDGILIINP